MRARIFAVLALLIGCRAPSDTQPVSKVTPAVHQVRRAPSLDDALLQADAPALRRHVDVLASDDMRGRATPSPQLDAAAEYIASEFSKGGVDARRIEVACGALGEPAFNVIGTVPGATDERVLVTAHYDHIGETDEGDDRIFNGANDNASGVAAMLEVADVVVHAPRPLRRTVVFVAFCGEEHGLVGSRRFVEDPPFPLDSVVAVLNLEMLGHPDPADPRRAWVTGHAYSSLPQWLDRAGRPENVRFVPGHEIGTVEGDAFGRSDNYPFALRDVVAHTVAAGPLDTHYHAVSDEPERVDVQTMVPLVRALARATVDLADGDGRPRWTAPASTRR